GVGDRVKDTAQEGIEKLDELGIEVGMLSGDKKGSGEGIGKEVGIERIIGEVLGEEKGCKVGEIECEGKKVGMVGDGVNDGGGVVKGDIGIGIGRGRE
uniref:HAD family hydrolase n=1 Tax=Staphylococcus epidermidis TaxID=1282 RepID=UPI0011A0EE2A